MSQEANPKSEVAEPQEAHTEDMYSAINNVHSQLEAIQTFVARRFDEISMEVNATAQQMDMEADGTSKKFGEIFEVLQAISFSDGGDTAANTGVELDAVIETTEKAANTILDAAERLSERIQSTAWDDEAKRTQSLSNMEFDVQEIIMACSFQDVTGQRINKTLENIKGIEDRLGGALKNMGIEVESSDEAPKHKDLEKGASQSDIDELFD